MKVNKGNLYIPEQYLYCNNLLNKVYLGKSFTLSVRSECTFTDHIKTGNMDPDPDNHLMLQTVRSVAF